MLLRVPSPRRAELRDMCASVSAVTSPTDRVCPVWGPRKSKSKSKSKSTMIPTFLQIKNLWGVQLPIELAMGRLCVLGARPLGLASPMGDLFKVFTTCTTKTP